MLQARYRGAGIVGVSTAPSAEPGPGEVRIDVAYTGICGTDLHIFHGDMDSRVQVPAVLGHEMSGRVARLGDGVDGWAVGDPVTVMPLDWCGTCPACRAGNTHVCQRLTFIGIDSPGAMQQSWVVPERTLVRIPAGLDLRSAALIEPTAVAVHDVRRAEVNPGDQVLVVGGGPVGVLIALGARLYTRDDFETAAGLVHDATIPAERLITHVEPLASAERAFETLAGGTGQMKVLVDCAADT
jgi:(R,R)-butanediol dehydrogenase/meso-butanediol dehydrogenase/diacetyl reductase